MTDSPGAFMREALRLARAGLGATYPNPCVGAVVVRRGRLVGRGRSAAAGGPHAEVRALAEAGRAARGSTLYVTLEPCNHHGRTPPCVDAILAAGVERVVVALVDPAAHVAGRGLRRLRRAGVSVELGEGSAAAREVHAHYLHHVSTGRPFVTLKLACSVDGRLATASGDSRWISGEASRRDVHRLRARHHGIAVGAATVLADDPRLDVRLARGVDPLPIVFDPRLQVVSASRSSHLLRPGVLYLHGPAATAKARRALAATGAELLEVDTDRDGLSICAALDRLGERDLRSLMVEGGGRLHAAFIRARAWQELWIYRAPIVLGGDGRPAIAALGLDRVAAAPGLRLLRRRAFEPDELCVYAPIAAE